MNQRTRLILLIVGLLLISAPLWGCWQEDPDPLALLWAGRPLTYEEAISLALALDEIADSLQAPPLERSDLSIQALTAEIAPYFYYEGVTGNARIPLASWALYDNEDHFHVAGRYYSLAGVVTLNARHANPWATRWYNRPYLQTLVHEIGHAEGILGGRPGMEATNQLATLEVLAAMARDRNVWALPAFIETLREYAEDYAWSLALKQDRLADYYHYIYQKTDNEFEVASFQRSMDHWAPRMGELKRILADYGELPFLLVLDALGAEDLTRCELDSLPNLTDCLVLNDTAWILRHLGALVMDYDTLLLGSRR